MSETVEHYLEELRDLPCGPVLRMLVGQIGTLDPGIETEVGSYGLRFRIAGRPLCEISVFGELFIARVGRELAVEYRVRRHEGALEVLDRILRELQTAPPISEPV